MLRGIEIVPIFLNLWLFGIKRIKTTFGTSFLKAGKKVIPKLSKISESLTNVKRTQFF